MIKILYMFMMKKSSVYKKFDFVSILKDNHIKDEIIKIFIKQQNLKKLIRKNLKIKLTTRVF